MTIFRFSSLAIAIVMAGFVETPARTEPPKLGFFTSGNALWEDCSAKEGDVDFAKRKMLCFTYVTGVVDATAMFGGWDKKPLFCIPQGVTKLQLADIVGRSLESHPEWRHQPAPELVSIALVGAFPCRNPTK